MPSDSDQACAVRDPAAAVNYRLAPCYVRHIGFVSTTRATRKNCVTDANSSPKVFPIISGVVWLATLLGLLIYWNVDHGSCALSLHDRKSDHCLH